MNLDQIEDSGVLNKAQLLQAKQSLSQCILETRALSHLLHPPLLDKLGLEAAIRSFVEGYTERSGIKVNLTISSLRRFDNAAETALFRIIQEGLTNLHRHSGSQTADIILSCEKDHVQLNVRDYGKGIPEHVLTTYRRTGTGVGVGIAGMHERVAELHGRLELHSDASGTRICISLPIRQSQLQ